MAKYPFNEFMLPGRGVRLPGLGYTAERHGSLYYARSPQKISKTPTPGEYENQQRFKRAALNVTYMSAGQQLTARELSQRSAFMVRDYLTITLFARAWNLAKPGGGRIYALVARNDISQMLDAISQTPGTMLWRGINWWEPIEGGQALDVLTTVVPGQKPQWLPPGGTGGNLAGMFSQSMDANATVDSAARNGKGMSFLAEGDSLIHEVWMRTNLVAGETYKGMVATMSNHAANGTWLAVHTTPQVTDASTVNARWRRTRFLTPIPVFDGEGIFVGQYRDAGSTTASIPMYGSTTGVQSITAPGRPSKFIAFSDIAPVAGDPYVAGADPGSIGIGFVWSPAA